MKTRMVLCSIHFFKNIIKKVKNLIKIIKYPQDSSDIKNIFLFSFTLLLNSLSIKQFENILTNIINVMSSPYFNETVLYSFGALNEDIKAKNLNSSDIDLFESPYEIERSLEMNKLKEIILQQTNSEPSILRV